MDPAGGLSGVDETLMGVELTLEIQTTIQGQFMRMHRSVNLLAIPLPGG
jgi:hypothetical protein